jgi:4-hydroxy-2-oxoheptanedioate aldolase
MKKVRFLWPALWMILLISVTIQAQDTSAARYVPKRINKCIELLQERQPIYYIETYGGYEEGKKLARTWADYIYFNMEHSPVDFGLLREFMKGLVDGGPTPSGHRTPTVIAIVPALGLDAETFKGGSWMVQQALAQGVHGVHLCRARSPEAVKLFVEAARYPFHNAGRESLDEGVRGFGSQKFAAWVWGIDEKSYLLKADVWPLNPEGEIMLGLKIEDKTALAHVEKSLKVAGIAFAEHGPRDMGFSYGYLDGRADPPVPVEVAKAGDRVLAACKRYGVFFLDNVLPENVVQQIQKGVMIGAGRREDSAEVGRRYTRRTMPW